MKEDLKFMKKIISIQSNDKSKWICDWVMSYGIIEDVSS